MRGLGVLFDSLLLSDVVVWWWLSVNAFCSWVVLSGIFFRICPSSSTVFSLLSHPLLSPVLSLCPLLGLFRWYS